MRRWWIAGAVVAAALGLFFVSRSPKRIEDKRFVGTWVAPNYANGIRFMADGTAVFLSDQGVLLSGQPFAWWAGEASQLHYFVQDEDASTWASVAYSFQGNDRLKISESLMGCPVGTDLVRK